MADGTKELLEENARLREACRYALQLWYECDFDDLGWDRSVRYKLEAALGAIPHKTKYQMHLIKKGKNKNELSDFRRS